MDEIHKVLDEAGERWRASQPPNAPVEPTSLRRDSGSGARSTNAQRDDFGEAMLVGVEIPSAGCWQITASYGDAVLSYVVLITDG